MTLDRSLARRSASLPLVLAGLCAGGCATPGYRAQTGDCPFGQTCSDQTPAGLVFVGTRLAGDWPLGDPSVKALAVGGTETLLVENNDVAQTPLIRFDADIAEPGWSIVNLAPPHVTVTTTSDQKNGFLRILDQDGLLEDEVRIPAAPVDHIAIEPDTADLGQPADDAVWALHTGATGIYVDLLSASGDRLADESATLRATTGDPGQPRSWDRLGLSRQDPGSVDVEITTGGGQTFAGQVAFVDHIDTIQVAPWDNQVTANSSAFVCFSGLAGQTLVYGIDWTFEVGGALTDVEPLLASNNCVAIAAGDAGTGTLTARADGQSVTLEVPVVAASQVRLTSPEAGGDDPVTSGLVRAPGDATRGVRARMQGAPAATMAE